jgi:hypothetical protein
MTKLEIWLIITNLLTGFLGFILGVILGLNKQQDEFDLCSLTRKDLNMLVGLFPQYLELKQRRKKSKKGGKR